MKAKRNACRTKKELTARSRRAFSRRAAFEPLEARHMMSAGNLFAEFVGTLTPAAPVERLDVQIAPEALGLMRDKALLGFEVRGRDGQTFDPAAVQIVRPDGSLVKPEFAADNLPGSNASVVVAELAEGNYTIKVGGSLSARSQFFMDVFLVGDANGDHRVGRDDLDFIRANYGASSGDARYNLAADANLDGRITAIDLSLARRNQSDSHAPAAPLLMMACAPGSAGVPPAAGASSGQDARAPAGIVPTRGYDPDAPMRFYESTGGLVQPLSMSSGGHSAVFAVSAGQNDVLDWIYREAGYNNSLSIYRVDNAVGALYTSEFGSIDPTSLLTNDEHWAAKATAYRNAALQNVVPVFTAGERPNNTEGLLEKAPAIPTGWQFYSVVVRQNGDSYYWFPFDTVNEDAYAHFVQEESADATKSWYDDVPLAAMSVWKVEDLSPTLPNPNNYPNDADYNDLVFVAADAPATIVRLQDAEDANGQRPIAEGGTARFKVILNAPVPAGETVTIYYATKFDKTDNNVALVAAGADDFAQSTNDSHIIIAAGQSEGTIEINVPRAGPGVEYSEEFLVVIVNAPGGFLIDKARSKIVQNDSSKYDGLTLFTPTGRCQIKPHDLPANPWEAVDNRWWPTEAPNNTNGVPNRDNTQAESMGYWRKTTDGSVVTYTTPKGNPWTHEAGKTADLMNAEGPYLKTAENDFTDFTMTLEYRCLDTVAHNPLPMKNRKDATTQWPANPATNEHFGNAGIYIFDRYEVQIIDPSKWGVQTGGDIKNQGPDDKLVAKRSQLTPGGAYNVFWNSPAGGDAEFDENAKPVYGFVYNFKNRALATGEWNRLTIDFHAPVLAQDGTITRPAHMTVWLQPATATGAPTNDGLVFKGWLVDASGKALKGTGSRGASPPAGQPDRYPPVDTGAIYLQGHWGSQVEFRRPNFS